MYYNPHTKQSGRAFNVYLNELNVGLNPLHTSRLGTELILKYPKVPDSDRFQRVTSDLAYKSIFDHPIITYEIYLPTIDQICPLKFYDDDIFGLPYLRLIPHNCQLQAQLPDSSHTLHFLLSLNTYEPIHADSSTEKFTRLRTTYANKKISIT